MICLMIGILIAVIVSAAFNNFFVFLGIFTVFVVISFFPLEGYKEQKCVSEVELIKLNRGYENKKYVEAKGKKATYTCDVSSIYELDTFAYEEKTVRGKIKVFKSKTCREPIMKKYVKKPKRDLFALAPFSTKIEYVFVIPENGEIKDQDMVDFLLMG